MMLQQWNQILCAFEMEEIDRWMLDNSMILEITIIVIMMLQNVDWHDK